MQRSIYHLLLLAGLGLASPLFAQPPAPTPPPTDPATLPAPLAIYPEPAKFFLLRLAGDRVDVYYTPGSLDRAANLQHRLDVMTRGLGKWYGERVDFTVYLLSRRDWEEEARIAVPYGVPVRVGERGIAGPSRGDDGTIELWRRLLDGRLPTVGGTPMLGTPEELSSLVLADVFIQVHAGAVWAETVGLDGEQLWLDGMIAQLASYTAVVRLATDRPEQLTALYLQFLRKLPPRSRAARDYGAEIGLEEWLWFQAQFHNAAQVLYGKKGKALEILLKLDKRGGGVVSTSAIRKKFEDFETWYEESFAAVSLQR